MTARDLIHKILKGRQALPWSSRRSPTPPEAPSPAPATGNPCHLPTPVPQRGTAPPTGNLPPRDAQAAHGDGAGRLDHQAGRSAAPLKPPPRLIKSKPVLARASSDPDARDVWHDSSLEGLEWTPALERAGVTWTYSGTEDAWLYALDTGRIEPPRGDRMLKGFPISRNGKTCYRPDYWLPEVRLYVEVKPSGRDIRRELWKPTAFARACRAGEWPGRDVVVVTGSPTKAKLARLLDEQREEAA
jgi:hypothetical protein